MTKKILLLIMLFLTSIIAKENNMSIYDFNVKTIDGEEVSMSKYKGKVLLIVNVASKCGFTNQYEGLEKLFAKDEPTEYRYKELQKDIKKSGFDYAESYNVMRIAIE